jgi:hypothetical protein
VWLPKSSGRRNITRPLKYGGDKSVFGLVCPQDASRFGISRHDLFQSVSEIVESSLFREWVWCNFDAESDWAYPTRYAKPLYLNVEWLWWLEHREIEAGKLSVFHSVWWWKEFTLFGGFLILSDAGLHRE